MTAYEMSGTDRRVLAVIERWGALTVAEIVQVVDLPEHAVRDAMNRLAMLDRIHAVDGLWSAVSP